MNNIFEKNFDVCTYDVDVFSKIKTSSTVAFFQEVASLHAAKLGVGYFDLAKNHHVFWALSRLSIQINNYPKWNDVITYKTWPTGYNRLHGLRDFNIINDGKIIGSGSSDWIIMDSTNKQIVNPQTIVGDIVPFNEQNHFGVHTSKVRVPSNFDNKSIRKVRYNDLDMNHHVNSIKYLEWVFDCLPMDVLLNFNLSKLTINYQSEIPANSEVEIFYSQTSDNPTTYVFKGKIVGSERISFLMNLEFASN